MKRSEFYTLSFTWGLPMTLIGLIVAAVLICTGHRPKVWCGCLCFTVGKSWGGVSFGIVMVTDGNDSAATKYHECGHAIQNCKYGLAMPFIVSIPSAIRYWYRKIKKKMGFKNKTGYYDIWFEKEATELGAELKAGKIRL